MQTRAALHKTLPRTKKTRQRIYLSPPHLSGEEANFVRKAFESNYIAPLGPQVDAFEREFSRTTGIRHCLALSSGTAAMHTALRLMLDRSFRSDQKADVDGRKPLVLASTLTFIASVTPAIFERCDLTFIDCDQESWNMDPDLLEAALAQCKKEDRLPAAVIPTDLYGQCCNLPRIMEICRRFKVPVICDSAEAMGAWYRTNTEQEPAIRNQMPVIDHSVRFTNTVGGIPGVRHAGSGADAAVYSFNGNKIITTSGGGMLASDDEEFISRARFLSQQARDSFPHYEHTEIGYNYRMSNILAAIGRGQLRSLDKRVARKREIFQYYVQALGDLPGIEFMPEAPYGRCTRWLTVALIHPEEFGADRERVRLALESKDIESRPVWKPMHMQPVFNGRPQSETFPEATRPHLKIKTKSYPSRVVGGAVSENLFQRGLCLPSGTAMTEEDLERVVKTVKRTPGN